MNNISILSSLFISDNSSQSLDVNNSESSDFKSFFSSFVKEQEKFSSVNSTDKKYHISAKNSNREDFSTNEISEKLSRVLTKDSNILASQYGSTEEVSSSDEVASSLASLIMMMTDSNMEQDTEDSNNIEVFEKLVAFIKDSNDISLETLRNESKELLAGLSVLFNTLNENISLEENSLPANYDGKIHIEENTEEIEQPKTILELLSLLQSAKQKEKYDKEAEENALKKLTNDSKKDGENEEENSDSKNNEENLLSQVSLLSEDIDIKQLSLNNEELQNSDNSKILNKLVELIESLSNNKDEVKNNTLLIDNNSEVSDISFTESLLVLKKELENVLNNSSKDLKSTIEQINPQVLPNDNFYKTGNSVDFSTSKIDSSFLKEEILSQNSINEMVVEDNKIESSMVDDLVELENSKLNEELISDDANLEQIVKDSNKNQRNEKNEKSNEVLSSLKQENLKGDNLEIKESVKGSNEEKFSVEAKFAAKDKNNSEAFLSNESKPQDKLLTQNQTSDIEADFNTLMKEASNAPKADNKQSMTSSYTSYDLRDAKDVAKLMRTIESTVNKGESKLTVTLRPDDLGRLEIRLIETGGKINAKFFADNETSYRMMLSHSDAIRNQLAEKGIVIDNMEFAFNDTTSKQGTGEDRKSAKYNGNKKSYKDNDENDKEVGTNFASKRETGIYA